MTGNVVFVDGGARAELIDDASPRASGRERC